jgi:peptidoglycan/LPS O-acetylase OafA/YrhL
MAVYLFFMLSGYWVYQMWHKEYAPTRSPYLCFVISRFWRLLPVYYVALLFYVAINLYLPGPEAPGMAAFHDQGLAFYISNLVILGYAQLPFRPIGPVWSLDIEMQFYIIAPIVIYIFTRTAALSVARVAVYAATLAGIIVFLIFYGNLKAQNGFLPMYLVFFLIGLQSAHSKCKPSGRVATFSLASAGVLIFGIILLPVTRPLLVEGNFTTALSDFNTLANVGLAFVLAPYAMATVRRELPKGSRASQMDRDLGNITYEVYLLHEVSIMIIQHFVGRLSHYAQIPYFMAAWVAVFLVSCAVYYVFDRPIDAKRKAFVKSMARNREPALQGA